MEERSFTGPGSSGLFCVFLCEGDVGIHQASSDADVQTDEVGPGEDVVPTEHHPDVRHHDILDTPDDGGGERRVVLRAQHDGVHQNEAHDT